MIASPSKPRRKMQQRRKINVAQPAIRPLLLDLGCCGLATLGPGWPAVDGGAYDLVPAQANLLIVAGRISPAICPHLDALYQQLAQPRWVIAYGVCAISGAIFDTIAVEHLLPVDARIAGCPPHPNALYHALSNLSRQKTHRSAL